MGITKRPLKPVPEQYDIAPWHFSFADRMGLAIEDMMYETEQWLDHHRAKGSRFADWDAAWRTWMRNTQKYGTRKAARPAGWRAQAMQQSFEAMDRFVNRMTQEGHDVGTDAATAQYSFGSNPTAYAQRVPPKAQRDGRLLAG